MRRSLHQHRGSLAGGASIATSREAAARDEDRVGFDDRGAIALADGAGGMSRAAEAADAVIDALGRVHAERASAVLSDVDASLARRSSGETTAVLARLAVRGRGIDVEGALAGNSRIWARGPAGWTNLWDPRASRPRIGSGRAQPAAFSFADASAVVVVSDGIADYVEEGAIHGCVDADAASAGGALIELARGPDARLRDDASVIVVWMER